MIIKIRNKKYQASIDLVKEYGLNKDQIRYLCKTQRVKYIVVAGQELRELKRKNNINNIFCSSLILIEEKYINFILNFYKNKLKNEVLL